MILSAVIPAKRRVLFATVRLVLFPVRSLALFRAVIYRSAAATRLAVFVVLPATAANHSHVDGLDAHLFGTIVIQETHATATLSVTFHDQAHSVVVLGLFGKPTQTNRCAFTHGSAFFHPVATRHSFGEAANAHCVLPLVRSWFPWYNLGQLLAP